MSATDPRPQRPVSGWAVTGVAFATVLLMIVGVFQIVTGLSAIFGDAFFVVSDDYAFRVDVTVWGVVQLVVGLAMLAAGIGLLQGSSWAAVAAIVIAGGSAIVNFLSVPYYPLWSLLVIALDVWIIWSVTRPGVLDE
jgi:hypothetical protein